jgi:hypothetical protein
MTRINLNISNVINGHIDIDEIDFLAFADKSKSYEQNIVDYILKFYPDKIINDNTYSI